LNQDYKEGSLYMENYQKYFERNEIVVPLLNGTNSKYINFDNAASTPAMDVVRDKVDQFLNYYSSVHRGTGFKSQLSTSLYEESRRIVMRFVGASAQEHVCIFGKNTTEAINKLAKRFPFSEQKNVVLVSSQEHHSNDLPWRAAADVIHIGLTPEGELDEADYDRLLKEYQGKLALVSITGASNVTGYINPIHRLAAKAHAVGAQICVDCAQLAPHRKIRMGSLSDPEHLDYVTLSAHKMYAPYGTGALIGRRDTFSVGDPDLRGGGEVEIVTMNSVVWSDPPERDEAGSPNTVGAVALAAAITQLEKIGMDRVAAHEAELTEYALTRLNRNKQIVIYGDTHPDRAETRLGVIPVNLSGLSHYYVAAVLGFEYGIGVRNGCFCAHPYLLKLMHVDDGESGQVRQKIIAGDKREIPGLVRISFGLYNTLTEVDVLVDALQKISAGKAMGQYRQDQASGAFIPDGWQPEFDSYFHFSQITD
jgi:cysteine desulfurase / selenocysteine lyase